MNHTTQAHLLSNEQGEIWRDIPGYEGYYQASTLGRIRSIGRLIDTPRGKKYCHGVIRHQRNGTGGYKNVALSKDGSKKQMTVHRIIAKTFIPNPNNLPIINHINGDTGDNRVENLEWCTLLHNYKHAADVLGKNCGLKPILCEETGVVYESIHEVARAILKTPQAVWNVVQGKKKTAGGYHFRYANK